MDDYAGRVLADRYRLPLAPEDGFDLVETRAFDTYSGQEVLVRQVPLPEVVDAEVLDGDDAYGTPDAYMRGGATGAGGEDEYAGAPGYGNASGYGDAPGYGNAPGYGGAPGYGRTTRRPADPAVRRAVEAAQAAAQIPDHPRLDQVFDVFAQDGSLWIVSELIAARPLSALLAERPMNPFRAAEVASDVLTALAVLHAHGWTHRNITARTVLICDDGRVVLTGLAAGAAEEALCGYAPVPLPPDGAGFGDVPPPAPDAVNEGAPYATSPDSAEPHPPARPGNPDRSGPALPPGAAARTGVVAAYRAGAGAATRTGADGSLPAQRPDPEAAPPPEPEGGTGRADQGMYDPVRGVRVAGGATASPYADDRGPDSGRTRRQYDPVTGRWVPRPAAPAPRQDSVDPDPDPDAGRSEGRTSEPGRPNSPHAHGSSGSASAARAPAPRTPALPPGFRADAFRADSQRRPHPSAPPPVPSRERASVAERRPAPGDPSAHPGAPYRGPANRLAAERARHTRIAVVGAVTERWSPEQAGPIHENWRLAPPIGPATDLWALGALMFRAVQGHAPYPEESAAELVQMVCAEPPAFAEECGPLRPVVESLLRQDPTERPEFEELRGWLRSLVRSAPEPDAGTRITPLIVPDAKRLPILRRRGELVRRRRRTAPVAVAPPAEHGRHRHRPAAQRSRGPRSLGRLLLVLIMLLLAGAVAYAMFFMPRSDQGQNAGSATPPRPSGQRSPGAGPGDSPAPTPGGTPPSQQTQTTGPGGPSPSPAAGYAVRKDPEGFQVGVDKSWQRQPMNDAGQVRYVGGDFTLIVVPGRDAVRDNGSDPLAYQADKERELQPYRNSSWSTSSGLRRIDVGQQSMAEGQFTWRDSSGRQVYVRNLAMIVNGRYHVVQVIGPESQRDRVTEIFGQATGGYRATR
ncbi:protein kinase [Streptomyces sp. ASQP_92]|uniref:protein kinase n=1 Tax=Streptomyces sp. ASQP_92 TaxID=2979116 RepID=UPI0021C0D8AF|nr:protein kinase [Streptomyces sp. ASQP_92]MCT9089354.1 protein kinase [Streptomyces sp. ASQP_92]